MGQQPPLSSKRSESERAFLMAEDYRFPSTGEKPYMKVLKGEMPAQKLGFFMKYKKAYFDTGSVRPVMHAAIFLSVLGYVFDYSRHLIHFSHKNQIKHAVEHAKH